MVLGFQFTWQHIAYLGVVTIALLVFEMLVGLRVIKFKGRTHMKVHRRGAWALLILSLVHAWMALALYNGWSILS